MNYEKAYKDALAHARQAYGSGAYDDATLEAIFPELKESEDERIRKELKGAFEVYDIDSTWNRIPIRSILAWLEKQKEQKPILEVFGFKVGDAVRLKNGDGRKHIIKSFEEVEGLHGPNFYHVEFEDNSARDGIYPGEEYPNGYYTQMEKFEEEQKPWKVGANAYFTPEQKPAEWSEKHIADIFEKVGLAKIAREQGNDKLTNALQDAMLELSKVENAEWSDNDNQLIGFIFDLLNDLIWRKDWAMSKEECLVRLKSLRPSWKPSEEQMMKEDGE